LRHPLPLKQSGKRELGMTKGVRHYVNFIIENNIPEAISKEEIIVSTGNDRELQKLIKCVEEKSIDHKDTDIRKYCNVFNELAVVDGLFLVGVNALWCLRHSGKPWLRLPTKATKVLFVQSSYSVPMCGFLVWTQWSKSM